MFNSSSSNPQLDPQRNPHIEQRARLAYAKKRKRSELAGSVGCRCGSSLLAEAVPRLNSRMDSCAPRIQPSVLWADRIAARFRLIDSD